MKYNNYLIFRDDGVGDLLLITPVLKLIKKYDKKSNILLISSSRNNSYAELLLRENLVDDTYNIDQNKLFGRAYSLYYLVRKIHKFNPSVSLIYRQKLQSYLISKIFCKNNFGLVTINSSNYFKKRYRPFKFLTNYLLDDYVVIDQRDNFKNIYVDHWSDFYLDLFKKAYQKIFNKNLSITQKDKKYVKTIDENLNNILIKSLNEINNTSDFILLHIDEKWSNTNWSPHDLDNLIDKIIKSLNVKIIISEGASENSYSDFIYKKYLYRKNKNTDFNISLTSSDKMKNVAIFKDLDIEKLILLSLNASLVITNHGSLTHFSSINDVPVIDLIHKNKKEYLKKYYPKSSVNEQVILNSVEELLIIIKKLYKS